MNFFKILLCSLLVTFSLTNSTFAADDAATATLKSAMKKAGSKQVDYNTGCPNCVKEMLARGKVKLDSKENNQSIDLTLLSEKEVQNLFKELAANKDIPFGFPFDGCYARAQAMAELMEQKGIICGKAFVEGKLKVDSPEFGEIEWRYHVAPVVMVKVNGKNVPYVIDPSIFDKPVPFTEWRGKMTSKSGASESSEYFTNRFSYDPDDKNAKKSGLDQDIVEDYQAVNSKYSQMLAMYRLQKKNQK